jgi:hypothetical protein
MKQCHKSSSGHDEDVSRINIQLFFTRLRLQCTSINHVIK